ERRQIRWALGSDDAQRHLAVLKLHIVDRERDPEGAEVLVRPGPKGRLGEELADHPPQDLVPVTGLRVERAPLGFPRLLALRLEFVSLLCVADELSILQRLERRLDLWQRRRSVDAIYQRGRQVTLGPRQPPHEL